MLLEPFRTIGDGNLVIKHFGELQIVGSNTPNLVGVQYNSDLSV